MDDHRTEDNPRPRKPHVNVGAIGRRSPMLGAALLGTMMAIGGASLLAGPRSYSTGASAAQPDDLERAKRAEEKRKRRASKPGASDYAKRNA